MWCGDGVELGSSFGVFKVIVEELVWKRRKIKGRGERRERRER